MRVAVVLFCCALARAQSTDAQLPIPHIVGGEETTIDKYPFMAALLRVGENELSQMCGGTVVHKTAIMTAAHCISGSIPEDWRARVGSSSSVSGGTIYAFGRFIIHPNFNRISLNYDIALMFTTTDIIFTDVVQQAYIPTRGYKLADNEPVWAAGWGVTESKRVTILRHVEVKIINQKLCKELYSVRNITVTENMLCAGDTVNGGKDQCYADSGSPLVHNGTVVGICSGGVGCGNPKFPGINTKVSKFFEWIGRQL